MGIRSALPHLFELLNITSVLDVPCGDFNWAKEVTRSQQATAANLRYVGGDIVHHLVTALQEQYGRTDRRLEFMHLDLSRHMLWPVDLVIVRDVLMHFSDVRGLEVLHRINRSGARFLLTTTFTMSVNSRAKQRFVEGRGFESFWWLNLNDTPFNLPPPLLAIGLDGEAGWQKRVMGLWRLPLAL